MLEGRIKLLAKELTFLKDIFMAHAGSAHGITVDDMEIKGLLEEDEVNFPPKCSNRNWYVVSYLCVFFQDLMSGSEYWNLHLIVTNRNSVSRQNHSVAGIRCCNNSLLLRLLKNEFTPGVDLQRSGRAGFWALVQILAYTLLALPGQIMTKSTFFLYFHIEKINDKSLQLAF